MMEFFNADIRVQSIALFCSEYMEKVWDYGAVITSVLRTTEEQEALIKSGAPAVKNSPHLYGRAVDIRLNDFKFIKDIGKLVDIINFNFRRIDCLPTALVHGKGAGIHLHLQVPKEKRF